MLLVQFPFKETYYSCGFLKCYPKKFRQALRSGYILFSENIIYLGCLLSDQFFISNIIRPKDMYKESVSNL